MMNRPFVPTLMKMVMTLTIVTLSFLQTTTSHLKADGLGLNPDDLEGTTTTKKNVAVLQNRYFLKAWRPEVGLMVGTVTNEAYTDTKTAGFRLGVFLNEWVGVETQYVVTSVADSADRKALNETFYRDFNNPNKLVTADAEVNAVHSMEDFVMIAAPLYGKINLLDWALLYTDLYGTLGASRVSTDQGAKAALATGGGERIYFGKSWSCRLDFRDRIFNETRANANSLRNLWTVDFGISYLFR